MSLALLTSALERLSPHKRQPSTPTPLQAAAVSTVEALCYSLRSGVTVLSRSDVRQRILLLIEDQLQEVCARVRRHEPHIAPRWSAADVEMLISEWKILKESP